MIKTCMLMYCQSQRVFCHTLSLLSLHCSKQQIMKDRWMNVAFEDEELKPYIEPQPDYKDPKRTGGNMRKNMNKTV